MCLPVLKTYDSYLVQGMLVQELEEYICFKMYH